MLATDCPYIIVAPTATASSNARCLLSSSRRGTKAPRGGRSDDRQNKDVPDATARPKCTRTLLMKWTSSDYNAASNRFGMAERKSITSAASQKQSPLLVTAKRQFVDLADGKHRCENVVSGCSRTPTGFSHRGVLGARWS